jgi:hypothetical protein
MPKGRVIEIIPASARDVFALLHDYERRLEWDTLLQKAYLEPEFSQACAGAISVCQGRALLGGIALRTEYVSFQPAKVAAVKMLNRPPFFESFAASIRHRDIAENLSEIEYQYNFTAKPGWLRWLLHPLMNAVLKWETRKRLMSLKRYFANQVK